MLLVVGLSCFPGCRGGTYLVYVSTNDEVHIHEESSGERRGIVAVEKDLTEIKEVVHFVSSKQ